MLWYLRHLKIFRHSYGSIFETSNSVLIFYTLGFEMPKDVFTLSCFSIQDVVRRSHILCFNIWVVERHSHILMPQYLRCQRMFSQSYGTISEMKNNVRTFNAFVYDTSKDVFSFNALVSKTLRNIPKFIFFDIQYIKK